MVLPLKKRKVPSPSVAAATATAAAAQKQDGQEDGKRSAIPKDLKDWAQTKVKPAILHPGIGVTLVRMGKEDEEFKEIYEEGLGEGFGYECLFFDPDEEGEDLKWFQVSGWSGRYGSFTEAAKGLLRFDDRVELEEGDDGASALYVFTGNLRGWDEGGGEYGWVEFVDAAATTKLCEVWNEERLAAALTAIKKYAMGTTA